MSYLLDADICSAHLRNVGSVTGRLLQYTGRLNISVITLGELLSWTLRSKSAAKYHQGLLELLADVTVLDVDQQVGWKFGELRAALLDRGRPVPSIDLVIGATALVHSLTLVTHNVRDFANIPGLQVVDWLKP
jgi:tRNA(fMet)-specific endonuclease VapC